MNRKCVHIVVVFLLWVCAANAQEPDSVVQVDSTYEVAVERPAGAVFDQVDPAEVQLASRTADSSVVKELRGDKDLFYGPDRPLKKKDQDLNEKPWEAKPWFKDLMWAIIILAFVLIMIAFLYRSNAGIFRRKAKVSDSLDDEEADSENIFDIPYESEIQKAIASGKHHLAIRLLYLQTLRNLTAAGFIEYRQEKTNGDYVFQLFNSPFYKSFFSLTRSYEYVWYGKFPVSSSAFQTIQTEFSEFNRRIPV